MTSRRISVDQFAQTTFLLDAQKFFLLADLTCQRPRDTRHGQERVLESLRKNLARQDNFLNNGAITMLVLSRKKNESIVINGNICIEILQIKGKQIRLGITAPSSMKVLRGELPGRDSSVQRSQSNPAEITKSISDPGESKAALTQVVNCNLHDVVSAVMASS